MSLPVVGQLDAEEHQAEPGLGELLVCGGEVVSQLLALQEGEEAAGPAVAQEGAEVTSGGGLVVSLVVRQGEGQVEVVALQYIRHQTIQLEVNWGGSFGFIIPPSYYCLGFAAAL